MLFALHALDYGMVGLFLLIVLAMGAYFATQHRTVTDYCAGGRSIPWVATGISAAVTLLAAHLVVVVPSEIYLVGFKGLLAPIGICLAAPIAVLIVMPLLHKLDVLSIYEYLEFRFGPVVRLVVAGAWIVWRLLLLAVVVAVPCQALGLACGGFPPAWLWILIVGLVATAYTTVGGLRAVVWTDVVQLLAIVLALLALVGAVWLSLDNGSATVLQVAKELGRDQIADLQFSWTDSWSFFSALPLFVLLMLAISTIDQTVLQRLMAVEKARRCQRGYLVGVVGIALLLGMLTYLGVGLLAFFQNNHDSMRPGWVVNLDNLTHRSLSFADRNRLWPDLESDPQAAIPANPNDPLVAWDTDLRDFETLKSLVAQQRILRPNSKRPFENVDEFVDLQQVENRLNLPPDVLRSDGGADRSDDFVVGRLKADEIFVGSLAMKEIDDEIVLHERARPELLSVFAANRLGLGAMGLVVIGILAVSMASFDSGIHSLATVILVDFHRRCRTIRSWLPGRAEQPAVEWTESDELRLIRPLTAIVGLVTIILAFITGLTGGGVWLLAAVTIVLTGPLLVVFALGFATRSATTAGVLSGLTVGLAVNVWFVFGPIVFRGESDGSSSGEPLAWGWVMILGIVVTWVVGLVVSQLVGRRPTKQQIRGLVVGVGELGERDVLHEAISIPGEEDPVTDNPRWRQ